MNAQTNDWRNLVACKVACTMHYLVIFVQVFGDIKEDHGEFLQQVVDEGDERFVNDKGQSQQLLDDALEDDGDEEFLRHVKDGRLKRDVLPWEKEGLFNNIEKVGRIFDFIVMV